MNNGGAMPVMKISKFVISFSLSAFFSIQAQAKSLWVYFDLGDTVIRTKDMKNIKYIPGAREYMEMLKREGFKIGIISNIPETWGMDYQTKFAKLKKTISDGWAESEPFDWSVYDEVMLPLKDIDMKPAPHLFLKAMEKAESCPSIYIGESQKEIDAAKGLGMASKLFVETDTDLYVPILDMKNYIFSNYQREYDPECL